MIRRLDWDSAHFGFPIAIVEGTDVAAAAHQADREGIRCLYLYAEDDAVFRNAVAHRFEPIDVRIELEKTITAASGDVDLATEADLERLRTLARDLFESSRFFRDPRFPRDRSAAMFEVWVERAPFTVVLREGGEIVAFCACSPGRIELAGVAPEAQGQGAGRRVIAAAEIELARRGSSEVRVVTQGSNTAAMRLYERAGFVTRSSGRWFHRWAR